MLKRLVNGETRGDERADLESTGEAEAVASVEEMDFDELRPWSRLWSWLSLWLCAPALAGVATLAEVEDEATGGENEEEAAKLEAAEGSDSLKGCGAALRPMVRLPCSSLPRLALRCFALPACPCLK